MKAPSRFTRLIFHLLFITPIVFSQQSFWEASHGPYTGDFTGIAFNSSGHIFVGSITANAGGMNYRGAFRSTDKGTTWQLLTNGLVPTGVYCFSMLSNGTIYAGTTGTKGLYRSTDNGNSWSDASRGLAGLYVETMTRTNDDRIIFASAGKIYRPGTSDTSWVRADSGLTVGYIFELFTTAAGTVLICNQGSETAGGVVRSTDGGVTWDPNPGSPLIRCIAQSPSGVLYGGTTFSGLYRSTDDGIHWTYVDSVFKENSINDVAVQPNGAVSVIASYGINSKIFISSADVTQWSIHPMNGVFNKIASNAAGELFMSSYKMGVLRSTDNGKSWMGSLQGTKEAGALWIASDRDGTMFTTLTNGAGIFVSDDHGVSWKIRSTQFSSQQTVNFLTVTSDNVWWAGEYGLYRSVDKGMSWQQQAFPENSVYAFCEMLNGSYLASTDIGIYRSDDKAATWYKVSASIVNNFAQTSDETLYGANSANHVFRSFDLGVSWIKIYTIVPQSYVPSLAAYNNTLYLYGNADTLLISDDNGTTWSKKNVPVQKPSQTFGKRKVIAQGPNKIFLSTYGSDYYSVHSGVFLSTDNGSSWTSAAVDTLTLPYDMVIDPQGFLSISSNKGILRSRNNVLSVRQDPFIHPSAFVLEQNFPNPFNPSTTIRFTLPASGSTHHVSLRITDMLGRTIAIPVNEPLNAGTYSVDWNADPYASGIYIYTLQYGDRSESKRLVLLR